MGDNLLPVQLGTGRTALLLSTGDAFSCVATDDGDVRWCVHTAARAVHTGGVSARA